MSSESPRAKCHHVDSISPVVSSSNPVSHASPSDARTRETSYRAVCLTAADVFALGATAYELVHMMQPPYDYRLPTSGTGWHDIRRGRLEEFRSSNFSAAF